MKLWIWGNKQILVHKNSLKAHHGTLRWPTLRKTTAMEYSFWPNCPAGSFAFSQIVFSSTKRLIQKPLKHLLLCSYYAVTRPGGRVQCKRHSCRGSRGLEHGDEWEEAPRLQAQRAGRTGTRFSNPGDEGAQLVERGGRGLDRVMLKCQWDTHVERARGQSVCWFWSSGWQPGPDTHIQGS